MFAKVLRGFLAVAALVLVIAKPVHAQSAVCASQLYAGIRPTLINDKLAAKTRQLCYLQFVLLHSGVTRTPLWSAEHLTAKRIRAADKLSRSGSTFHSEKKLPASERAELRDYARSGYDRGHMSPSADMSNKRAQQQSFSLANIIPQSKCVNEHLWEKVESSVRGLAKSKGEVYAVTGGSFIGENLQTINDRVTIPTYVFKAVYVPTLNAAGAYWTPNDDSQKLDVISIARLQELIGVDVFPRLDTSVKQNAITLPKPAPSPCS